MVGGNWHKIAGNKEQTDLMTEGLIINKERYTRLSKEVECLKTKQNKTGV